MFTKIINELKKTSSSNTIFNPYKNDKIANNLKLYFEYLYKNNHNNILLIGEAPGYKGCRITGIPFTSGELFINSEIKIFKDLKDNIFLEKIDNENTATIIWDYLENKDNLPILWNAFPFHPFNADNQKSNRAPNNEEIQQGKYYIQELIKIFNPKIIASIGRKGEKVLKDLYPKNNIKYIRHPSYGGKSDFIQGMNEVYTL